MLVKYRLPIPPTSLKSVILEQGQAQLFAAGSKCRDKDKRSIVDRDKTDPQPVEFDIPQSPAGSLIGLYGACFGRLDLECPSKKAHLAGCDCHKSWPGFPQQKQSQSIRDRVYANGSCRRKRSTHPQIAKDFVHSPDFLGRRLAKRYIGGIA